eukprot:752119-Hanusia_phi.AAC.1
MEAGRGFASRSEISGNEGMRAAADAGDWDEAGEEEQVKGGSCMLWRGRKRVLELLRTKQFT